MTNDLQNQRIRQIKVNKDEDLLSSTDLPVRVSRTSVSMAKHRFPGSKKDFLWS